MTASATKTIPQPKPHLLLGNAPDVDGTIPVQSMMKLAREYGPIFRLHTPGKDVIIISSQELTNEVCDETRFDKKIHGVLLQQRENAGDGLFTAYTDEPNWGVAHRVLQPAFGPVALHGLFDGMWDIAEQLLLKWERLGPDERIDLTDNMTRLTLDTIALCAFSYRFNSFYTEKMHPYINAMVRMLRSSGQRARQPALVTRLQFLKNRQRAEDSAILHQTANEVIAERKKRGERPGSKDLLDLMLAGRDPRTGQGMSDQNIGYNMTTFLTAGHETTSGLLSFTFYYLTQYPEVMAKATAEVDRVLGNATPRYEHLAQLTYIDQVLKETLRLWPTAPAFGLYSRAGDTTIGGGYPISAHDTVLVLLPMLHRDPKVWGPDPETFNPDHFTPENFARLPPNAWKAFGNGQRSCIGRPFALQEAMLVLAAILQRFDITRADPGYQLHVKETLTLKPEGLFIKARRRNVTIAPPPAKGAAPATATAADPGKPSASTPPLRVLYGSNSGSAEAFAQRIATDAKAQGYPATLATLDEAVGHLPREGAVVIVTASYEGQPTDNARQFVPWLDSLPADALRGVKYAVFGCGNRDWVRTYQAIPKRIDERLRACGAERVIERGEADARGDFFGDFDRWYAAFWPTIGAALGQQARKAGPAAHLELEFIEGARDPILRQNNIQRGIVIDNRELADTTNPLGRSKRHIEIALPAGCTYRAGDYLAVQAENPTENIGRMLRRLGLAYDVQVILREAVGVQTFYPTGQAIMVGELLASYVDLGQPATRQQIQKLALVTTDAAEKHALEDLASGDAYTTEVLAKRVSVLDLLERYRSCDLPFAALLQVLPPLKPRQYSISSSPRWSKEHCTITVALVEAPAWSGQGTFRGLASSYLAHARPGMRIAISTRPSQAAFHLPDALATPIIMVGAGSGVAPFRGFLQERAIRAAEEGVVPGEALLFFGCNHPDVDFLYRDELKLWEQQGVVKVHAAYSSKPDGDVKYVQHRLWQDRAVVMPLMEKGARIYVCGDGKFMAPAVRETFGKMYQEVHGCSRDAVEAWLAELEKSIRYSQDVFA